MESWEEERLMGLQESPAWAGTGCGVSICNDNPLCCNAGLEVMAHPGREWEINPDLLTLPSCA